MAAAEAPVVDTARQPKETIYCHNLNEKLKKEGTTGNFAGTSTILCISAAPKSAS